MSRSNGDPSSSSSVSCPQTTPQRPRRPKRRVFSESEDSAWCEQLLEQKLEEKSREWEFDFAHGVPLPSSSARLHYAEVAADAVPDFYRPCTFDRRQSTSSEASSSDHLKKSGPVPKPSTPVKMELDQTCARAMAPVDRKKAVRTPKKSAAAAQQHQRKVTEFMSVRKRQRVSIVKKVAAGAGVGALTSPRRTPAHASSR